MSQHFSEGRGVPRAARAFHNLQGEDALLPAEASALKRTSAIFLAAMVLISAPVFWAANAIGIIGDLPTAVASSNSGSGSVDDSGDDGSGDDGSGGDDDSAGTEGTSANARELAGTSAGGDSTNGTAGTSANANELGGTSAAGDSTNGTAGTSANAQEITGTSAGGDSTTD